MLNLHGAYISVEHIVGAILTADVTEIDTLLGAVVLQYKRLYPQWDVATLSIDKGGDRNTQLDSTIAMLEHMKE